MTPVVAMDRYQLQGGHGPGIACLHAGRRLSGNKALSLARSPETRGRVPALPGQALADPFTLKAVTIPPPTANHLLPPGGLDPMQIAAHLIVAEARS